ncbi:MAG: hypothetical protein FJW38_01770 [Acidobacteria bacterium]|nr:hypothetical protein [Acidobacteriota bacterium]
MRLWLLLIAVSLTAQTLTRKNIASILDFENSTADRFPIGWSGSTAPSVIADSSTANTGRLSARIERTTTDNGFTTITAGIPYDFTARTIEYRGFIKTENVRDAAAMWIRIDGPAGSLAFASLQPQAINGSRDWREYSLTLQGNPEGRQLVFGFLLSGPGRAWVDSLQLIVDGKPIAEAPDREPTVLETDREFSAGSRIAIEQLSDVQVANLASLALVWGFVKYHHPTVTSGKRHWDFDLFRVMPAVLSAENTEVAAAAIADWVDALGPVPQCTSCASLRDANLQLAPPSMDWVQSLGDRLGTKLESIHPNRTTTPQFFVELFPNVGNPNLERELYYASIRLPDSGYQLLGLFRFWNLMQYFNPNRDIMGDDPDDTEYWNRTLAESIRPFALAKTRVEYQQAFLKLIAKVHDTHANLWSGISTRPPVGACMLPVDIRFVEDRPVVYRTTARPGTAAGPLRIGDVITAIDGSTVESLLDAWRPFYAASNEPTRLRDIGINMTRGACGAVDVTVDRGGETTTLAATRHTLSVIDTSRAFVHDLPGPAFQKPAEDIAYIKISDARGGGRPLL